jgi:hypothetical protein
MKRDIYLVVSIDTECDKSLTWHTRHPLEFASVYQGIPKILMPLFDSFGIKPTFLLSPEVMQDGYSCTVLSGIKNCELGTHLHGEFIEPQANWNNSVTDTAQVTYRPEIEFQKLKNITHLFEQKFSRKPRSFRAGRFGIGPHTLKFLVELGYRVDSSVTPFWTHEFDKDHTNNFWGAPLFPYHPSRQDIRKPGKLEVLEVPVTVANPFFLNWPRWILGLMNNRSIIYKRILPRLGFNIPNTTWLRPQRSSTEEMIHIAHMVIQHAPRNKPAVLNMMYHSVEVIPNASPYASNKDEVELIVKSQRAFFGWLFGNYSIKSVGLSNVPSVINI